MTRGSQRMRDEWIFNASYHTLMHGVCRKHLLNNTYAHTSHTRHICSQFGPAFMAYKVRVSGFSKPSARRLILPAAAKIQSVWAIVAGRQGTKAAFGAMRTANVFRQPLSLHCLMHLAFFALRPAGPHEYTHFIIGLRSGRLHKHTCTHTAASVSTSRASALASTRINSTTL